MRDQDFHFSFFGTSHRARAATPNWWSNRAPIGTSVGTPRGVGGRGSPLMLGYQKSGGTPAAHPARHQLAVASEYKYKAPNSLTPKVCHLFRIAARHQASSPVAGFGGRRFRVLPYEEAAKDCRWAGDPQNRIQRCLQQSFRSTQQATPLSWIPGHGPV